MDDLDYGAQVSDWTWHRSMERAKKRLEDKGLVRLAQPLYQYQDLGEITAVENLSELDLANLTLRHTSWYSYATVELAYARSAADSIDELFEVLVGDEMQRVTAKNGAKMLKDILRSVAIQNSDKLKNLARYRIDLRHDVTLLEGLVRGLQIRCRSLENEQIRRASARKLELQA